jgi:methylenetetrahydrofolate reductase (NADPH)
VDDVLVIGGSVKDQAGPYASSMDVLGSGLLERHGIRRAGVAGHPEGSPDIPRDAEQQALAWKNAFARDHEFELRLVTQFALAAEPYLAYEGRIREAGNALPVIAGLPGVTSPATLLKYGMACGIGPSLEILRKKSGGLLKLATTRQWKPTEIAEELAGAIVADPNNRLTGIHLFLFGGLERTAEWLTEMRGAGAEAVTA